MNENKQVLVGHHSLEAALAAMDILNSAARSQSGRAPRRAIYWLKSRYAIRDAVMAGLLTKMRAVQVTTKCSRCRNGIYVDWDGHDRGTCYTCNGRAKVTLKFIETEMAGKYRWHTPLEHSSWHGWPADDLEFVESQDWTVNQPGKEVSLVELVTALNIVETYWPQWRKHSPYELSRDEWDSQRYYIFRYGLNLGRSPEGCVLCGGPHATYAMTTVNPGLEYARSLCESCGKGLDEATWAKLAALPLPELHPEIQLWRERHMIDFGATWNRYWTDHVIESVQEQKRAPKDLEKWRQQITAQLAQGNSPKEIQWVRGVDCGLSSLALFRRLAKPQAATEASGRLKDVEENPIPRDAEDFARCVRMIEFCGWQSRLNEARDLSPAWEQIIQQWDNLCVMLKAGRNEEIHTFLSGLTA